MLCKFELRTGFPIGAGKLRQARGPPGIAWKKVEARDRELVAVAVQSRFSRALMRC